MLLYAKNAQGCAQSESAFTIVITACANVTLHLLEEHNTLAGAAFGTVGT